MRVPAFCLTTVVSIASAAGLAITPRLSAQPASTPSSSADIVFSRRVYAAVGRTYQQLWTWSPSDGSLTPLTNSARDHSQPICSPNGNEILFVSDPYNSSRPTRLTYVKSVWSLDRKSHQEHELWSAESMAVSLLSVAPDGDVLFHKEGLYVKQDGQYTRPGDALVLLKRQGEVYKVGPAPLAVAPPVPIALPPCEREGAWSRDGKRIACSAGQDIVVIDVATQKEVERAHFAEQKNATLDVMYSEPKAVAWSPDGTRLLTATYGLDSGSGDRYSDYFLLNMTAKTWTPTMSGNNAMWLPGRNAILYTTRLDLVPLPPSGEHSVWSTHLAVFDVATRKATPLTSGVTNNVEPTLCATAP